MKMFFIVFCLIPALIIPQTKTWQQSTAAEFSSGTLNNVMVTNKNGGEIRLIEPLTRQSNDTLNSSIPQYAAFDDAGNYVAGWVNNSRVYVQKFNVQNQPLTLPIIADDSGNVFSRAIVNIALLDNGNFVVGWRALSPALRFEVRNIQFFDTSGKKIGDNHRIFKVINGTGSVPFPIADQINSRYLILSPELVDTSNTYHILGLMYSSDGKLLRDSINMIPNGGTKFELNPEGNFYKGKLVLTWEGENTGYSPGDIYTALYDSNCVPITSPILVASQRTTSSAAFDSSGNFCVTFVQNSYVAPGPPGQIYAQVFDTTGRKLGDITQLTNLTAGSIVNQKLIFNNGLFRLRWTLGFSDGRASQLWDAYWKIEQITTGSYISNVFDAGNSQTLFKTLLWNASLPAGTQIKFQLRTASTMQGVSSALWMGPQSDTDYYTNAAGETINPANYTNRYLQAKILFYSSSSGITPVLNNFSVAYISSDTTAPMPPSNVAAIGGHRFIEVKWNKSVSPDVKTYRIYKTTGNNSFDKSLFVEVNAGADSYIDTSVVYNVKYKYAVSAVDSSFNKSRLVSTNLISPNTMTIFVSPSGPPQGDGTTAKPFPTIGDAIASAGLGDTVFVFPGEYDENVKLINDISLIGSNASSTKILSSNNQAIISTGANDVVKGFTINCYQGLVCEGDSTTITENIFLHQGSGFDVALNTNMHQDIVISKNIFMNFSIGIQVVSNIAPAGTQAFIRNNIIDCPTGVQNVRSNVEFINNTFIVKGSSGAAASLIGGNSVLVNNIFAGYPSQNGYIRSIGFSPGGTYSVEYNDLWGFNGDQKDSLSSTNISVNPQFKDPAKNNFQLLPGSGCINKGNPASRYNDVNGSRNDIGAYGGPDPLPDYITFALMTDISLNNVSGFPGDTVLVNVSLSNAAGLKKADINIRFNPSLMTFVNAVPSKLLNTFTLNAEQTSGNILTINLISSNEITSGSGNIFTLKFILNPSIKSDEQSPLEFGIVNLLDTDGERIFISSVTNGSCIIRANKVYKHRVFVDGTYHGTSDGTIQHPYSTIQEGINKSNPGDTVSVAAGVYTGPVTMHSNVFVMGLGANTTTINLPDSIGPGSPAVVIFNNSDSSGISGFSLVNNSTFGSIVQVMSSDAFISNNKIEEEGSGMYSIITDSASHVVITDNYFTAPQNGSIGTVLIFADSAVISRNVFNAASGGEVLSVQSGQSTLVINNRFYLSGGMGFTGYKTNNMIVANNLFSDTSAYGTTMNLMNSSSTIITNNVFDVKNSGITENSGTQQIYNNIFTGNDVALNIESTTIHQYNLFWNNKLDFGKGKKDPTEITADPLFVNQQEGNYKLQRFSPAINAGNPSVQWNDKDGTRNDIGLYGGPYADSTMFAALNSRLRIGFVDGSPGDTVFVPIYAVGIADISGIDVLLSFDSERLTLIESHTTVNTGDFVLQQKNIGNGTVELMLEGQHSIVLDSGAVMEMKFVINKNAIGTIPLNFRNVQLVAASSRVIQGVSFDNGGIVLSVDAVNQADNVIPKRFKLYQNYPNPFNPTTTICFDVPVTGRVTLRIYDILGREIKSLVNGVKAPGYYKIEWDASKFASGVYFYRIEIHSDGIKTDNFIETKKLLLLK